MALSVYNNSPVDTNVADGFVQDTDPGFSCQEAGVSGSYCDLTTVLGVSRTSNYALSFAGADATSPVTPGFPVLLPMTFQTVPPGLSVTIDGVTSASPVTTNLLSYSAHTIAVPSPQAGATGTQYVFANWSDAGAVSHSITVPPVITTYTASFTTQYLLTMSAANGTVSPPTGYFNAGSVVNVSATPANGFTFSSWTGPVTSTGFAIGTVAMTQPQSVSAIFAGQSGPVSSSGQVTPAVLNLVDYIGGGGTSVLSGSFTVSFSDGKGFSLSGSGPWLNTSVNGNTVNVSVNTQAVTGSIFEALNLTFTFGDGTNKTAQVTLQAYGTPQFTAAGGTTALTFIASAGSTAAVSQTFTVASTSTNIPAQATASSSGWLSVTGGGTTPQTFTAKVNPTGLAVGSYQATITIASTTAGTNPLVIPVTLNVTAATGITVAGFYNAGSLQMTPAAPNTIFTAFGTFPGCTAAQVTVDGNQATVFYSSATQINFLIPASVASEATTTLAIACAGLASGPIAVPVAAEVPSLFTVAQSGTGQADSINQDGSIDTPTLHGTVAELYGTGFGLYAPVGADGLTRTAQTVTATLGGAPVQVLFEGQAPGYTAGLQQIDILIPANATPGSNMLVLTIAGVTTQAGLTLTVQ